MNGFFHFNDKSRRDSLESRRRQTLSMGAMYSAKTVEKLPKSERKIELGVVRACLWMDGEPSFDHCCGAPTVPGKPYCDDHWARAWLQARPKSAESVVNTTQTETVLRNAARLSPKKTVAF